MMAEIKKRRSRRANGEGTITRRKDCLWQAAIDTALPDGTVRRRYLYNRDRDRLREQLNELAHQVGRGVPVPDGSMTVGEYLDQWLAEVAAKQVRPSTYTGYETNVRLHIKPLIGSKKLAKLTDRDIRQMIETLRSKPLSRGYWHHVGSSCAMRTVNRMFQMLTDHAGLRSVIVHDLRHGCVSLLLSLGVPPRTVMQIVGHTVMEMTTERYGHVNLDNQREALSLLDQALR
jgi:site-specific recombinase XerC